MGLEMQGMQIGTRVLMVADHPWAGHAGEVVRWEETPFGVRPVIRLDNGMECFAMKREDITLLG